MRFSKWFYTLPLRARSLFRRQRVEQELDDEMQYHLERHIEDNIARGKTPSEARYAALRAMGGLEQRKEEVRDTRGVELIENLFRDLRYALRMLRKNPGFSTTIILTLGLGIGACTAIFTVVNGVLLRPLPYPDPDSVVQLWELSDKGARMNVPEANFFDWQAAGRSFESMAMYGESVWPIVGGKEPAEVRSADVSIRFFDVLKVNPLIGTTALPDDSRTGGTPAIVVSYGFWQRVLGGASNLQDVHLSFLHETYSVIGVMPRGFGFPNNTEVWIPHRIDKPENPSRSAHNFNVIARLRPTIPANAASQELDTIARRIHTEYSGVTAVGAVVVPLKDQLTEDVSVALPVLLAAVSVLLLIACANVANLILVHAAARQRELTVRAALGAGRGALVRLFLFQTLLLAGAGGILGVWLSTIGVQTLLGLSSGTLPRIDEIHVDARVLVFAILLALAAGILLGIFPAPRAGRMNLDEMLRQAGRSQLAGSANRYLRPGLVIGQVALTVVLLVGTGLLGRSFVRIMQVDLGFQTASRIAVQLLLPPIRDDRDRQRVAAQYEETIERISAMPGVASAGGTVRPPLAGFARNGGFLIEGGKHSGDYWPDYRVATPGYFAAMGIPLIRGRLFDQTDGASTPEVAVISQRVARTVWPGEDPIGKRIDWSNMDGDQKLMTIVGIVGDVRNTPDSASRGDIYVHYLQRGGLDAFTFVIYAAGNPEDLARNTTSQVRSLNPEASLSVQTMDQIFSSRIADRRFNFALLAAFGATALTLALMGVYELSAYSVAQRTQEIGIRLALGAQQSDVTRMFTGEGFRLVIAGVVIGILGAAGVTRLLASLLFGIQPTDLPSYLLALIPMIGAALLASYVSARRAARVDPMITIRQ